jgi:NNP family nitrate/nitrite transporter-like MFS transporter
MAAASSNLVVMLAAAAATYLLSYAETYPQFLLAALGVGIAGGSFAVGVAYVSKFYPTASRVLRSAFSAPAMSARPSPSSSRRSCCLPWAGKRSRNIGPLGLVVIAVLVFFVFTKDDPDLVARRRRAFARARCWNSSRR